MNTKEAIGLITFGIGIGGVITAAIVSKLGFDHDNRQFTNGVEFGIALEKLDEILKEIDQKVQNNSEHDE